MIHFTSDQHTHNHSPSPHNPYTRLKTLLTDLGITKNIHKLASHPMPELTKEEKKLLLKGYKSTFTVKPHKKKFKTSTYDLYQKLDNDEEISLTAVFHCGSGPFKTIARTYFPRFIQQAFFLIHHKELKISCELQSAIDEACALYCVKTDDDFRNYHKEATDNPALKAHNCYLEFLADLCKTSSYNIQEHAFDKYHVPKAEDINRFWLHTIGKIDILDVEHLNRERLYKKGAARIMVLALLRDNLEADIRPEAPLLNPWESLFEILCGIVTHAELDKEDVESRIYDWRDVLKLWTEMTKGLIPRNPELTPVLLDKLLAEDIDLIKQTGNYFQDHLPKSASCGAAYVLQALATMFEHPGFDDDTLLNFIKETEDLWKSSPYSILLTDPKLDLSFALLNIIGWLKSSDWVEDSRIQIKMSDAKYSYVTLPLRLEESLNLIADNPDFLKKTKHLLPPITKYSPAYGYTLEEKCCEAPLASDNPTLRRLGFLMTLQRLNYLETPEPPSPLFYEILLSLNLTSEELLALESFHGGTSLSLAVDEYSLANILIETNDSRYYPVIHRLMERSMPLNVKELFSLYVKFKGSKLESQILSLAAGASSDWKLNESHDHHQFLVFIAHVIGTLIRRKQKTESVHLFKNLILHSSFPTATKLKIFRQMLEKRCPIEEAIAISLLKMVETDSECQFYIECILEFYDGDTRIAILKSMINAFRNAPIYQISDPLVQFCSQSLEEQEKFDFWQFALNNNMWSFVKNAKKEYAILVSKLYKEHYQKLLTNPSSSRNIIDTLNTLLSEAEDSEIDEEIASLQKEYIKSHPDLLSLDTIPTYHTRFLSPNQKFQLQLRRIKHYLDLGEIRKVLELTLRLKKIPGSLLTALEKSILDNPLEHIHLFQSTELNRVYKKCKKDFFPLRLKIFTNLSYDQAPHFLKQLLVQIVTKCRREQLDDQVINSLLAILAQSDKSDYSKEFLRKLCRFTPEILESIQNSPGDGLDKISILNRFDMLNSLSIDNAGYILRLCEAHVRTSTQIVETLVDTLLRHNKHLDDEQAGGISLALAEQLSEGEPIQALAWFEKADSQKKLDATRRTAFCLELMMSPSIKGLNNPVRFFEKLFPHLIESQDLVEEFISQFLTHYTPMRPIQELHFFYELYRRAPEYTSLDLSFTVLMTAIHEKDKRLTPSERKLVVEVLILLTTRNRSLFSSSTPGQIAYLSTFLKCGTNEQKEILIRKLFSLPALLLSEETFISLLTCAENLTHPSKGFISEILLRVRAYQEFRVHRKLKSDFYNPLLIINLNITHGSYISIDEAFRLLEHCLEQKTTKISLFKKSDLWMTLHNFLSSRFFHDELPPDLAKKRQTQLARFAINFNAKTTPIKTLILTLKLIQSHCHEQSLATQVRFWHYLSARQTGPVPTELKTLFDCTVKSYMNSSGEKKYLYTLSKYERSILYFQSSSVMFEFLEALIYSNDQKILKRVNGLLSRRFGTKMPQCRRTFSDAATFQIANIEANTKKAGEIIKKYTRNLIREKIDSENLTLHRHLFPLVTFELLDNGQYKEYRKVITAILNPEHKLYPIVWGQLFEIVEWLVYDLNIDISMNDSDCREALIILSDAVYEKLLKEKLCTPTECLPLVRSAITVICTQDKELLKRFNITRFCDLLTKHEELLRIYKQLNFLKNAFEDGNFQSNQDTDQVEMDIILGFAQYQGDAGFIIAIYCFSIVYRQLKLDNPEMYENRCGVFQKILAKQHSDRDVNKHMLADSFYSLHKEFKNESTRAEILETYSDLIRCRRTEPQLMVDVYGTLITKTQPSDIEASDYFYYLSHFASFEIFCGCHHEFSQLSRTMRFYIQKMSRVEGEMLDQIVSTLNHLLRSTLNIRPEHEFIEPVLQSLSQRENFGDFEDRLAPFVAFTHSWDDLETRLHNIDIKKSKETLILECASVENLSLLCQLPMLLAEYKAHVDPAIYLRFLSEVIKKLYEGYRNISPITSEAVNSIQTVQKIIEEFFTGDNEFFEGPPLSEMIHVLVDMIDCSITCRYSEKPLFPHILATFLHLFGHMQQFIEIIDYDHYFEQSEQAITIMLKDENCINSEIPIKLTNKSRVKSYVLNTLIMCPISEIVVKNKNDDYFERMFEFYHRVSTKMACTRIMNRSRSDDIFKMLSNLLLKRIPKKYQSAGHKELYKKLTKGWNMEEFDKLFGTDIKFVEKDKMIDLY